jgi:hypothetical protein
MEDGVFMMSGKTSRIVVFLGLFITAVISALFLWFLLVLPLRMVRPVQFQPVELTEQNLKTAEMKLSRFLDGEKTLELSIEEVCALIKANLEQELQLEISDIFIQFQNNEVSAFFNSRISDIPNAGMLMGLLKRKGSETTTTYLSALVDVEEGILVYSIREFRVGRVRIPSFLFARFIEGRRAFQDIYILELLFLKDSLRVERL